MKHSEGFYNVDPHIEKGDLIKVALFHSNISAMFNLEIESQSPLDLSFTENRVASGGVCTKRGDRHQIRSDYIESRVVD